MKNVGIAMVLVSMILSGCGGSDAGSTDKTSISDLQAQLLNTAWEKQCSAYNKFPSDRLQDAWNVKIKLNIDASLQATYRTEYFQPNDTTCKSMMFDALDITKLELAGKFISDESIEVNGLNETFLYNSGGKNLPQNYTLIYVNSEKLYFGKGSAKNSGKEPAVRHSSISLNDYFRKLAK